MLPALLLVVPGVSLLGLKVLSAGPAPQPAVAVALRADAQQKPSVTGLAGGFGIDVPASAAVPPRTFRDAPLPGLTRPAARAARRASRSVRVAPPWVMPLRGPLTSPYGPRWGGFHPGIDIGAPTGVPVAAATSGTVVAAGWEGGYGYVVRIADTDGSSTVYAHLSRIVATAGAPVRAGDTIGLVGSTGFSTGPHLHFEVRIAGEAINPLPWLAEHGVRA